jgi:hypothetical protein
LLFLIFSAFVACNKEDTDNTKNLKETDLLGIWYLKEPKYRLLFDEEGNIISFVDDIFNPHTFFADNRFRSEDFLFFSIFELGDYEFETSNDEIKFFSDPLIVEIEGIEVVLQYRYHSKSWIIQSFEDNQLTVTIRSWGRTIEGEIIESEDIEDVVYVKAE